jgi:hypothetical protein
VMVLVLEMCCFGVGKVSMSFQYLSTVNGKWWRWHCKRSACNMKLIARWLNRKFNQVHAFPLCSPFKHLWLHFLKYRTLYKSVFIRRVTSEISVHSTIKLKRIMFYTEREILNGFYISKTLL